MGEEEGTQLLDVIQKGAFMRGHPSGAPNGELAGVQLGPEVEEEGLQGRVRCLVRRMLVSQDEVTGGEEGGEAEEVTRRGPAGRGAKELQAFGLCIVAVGESRLGWVSIYPGRDEGVGDVGPVWAVIVRNPGEWGAWGVVGRWQRSARCRHSWSSEQ